jgi:hypothetical protein
MEGYVSWDNKCLRRDVVIFVLWDESVGFVAIVRWMEVPRWWVMGDLGWWIWSFMTLVSQTRDCLVWFNTWLASGIRNRTNSYVISSFRKIGILRKEEGSKSFVPLACSAWHVTIHHLKLHKSLKRHRKEETLAEKKVKDALMRLRETSTSPPP